LLVAAADAVTVALLALLGTIGAAVVSGLFLVWRALIVDRPQLTIEQINSVTEDARKSREEATEARHEAQRIHELLMASEEARRVDARKADATVHELRLQVADLQSSLARLTAELEIWKRAAGSGAP
jgi:polyhydroxyalkanoate synthesis regulator phasin